MRSDVIRIYKDVHTWTGILAGLALFIAFYAGAITVFKAPLERWAAAPGALVDEVPLELAPELIARTLEARPQAAKQLTIVTEAHEATPARLVWFERQEQDARPALWGASLDPRGELVLRQEQPSMLAQLVDVLHRTAGIPGDMDIGMGFMGIVSAIYALALISGVIVLLPTLVRDFFAIRLGKNLKRMWLDAHNVVGIVSLPFHLVMALSGLIFGAHDLIYETQNEIIYEGRIMEHIRGHSPFLPPPATGAAAPILSPQELLARIAERSPRFNVTSLTYHNVGDAAASVMVRGSEPGYLLRTQGYLLLDAVDGRTLNNYYFPGESNGWTAAASSFFSLHYGSFGGEPVRWSYFFLGLAGAFLFYSGNLLWIESRRRAARREQPSPVQRHATRLMASATVGVCLGCVCGVSSSIGASKWLQVSVADPTAWQMGLYYAVFLGSVAWAFLRGAARAAVELLWLAAALTLAIPLGSLVGGLWPASGLWMHTSMAALGIDIGAGIGALCLAWMARATARRAWHGMTDSVWSARRQAAA